MKDLTKTMDIASREPEEDNADTPAKETAKTESKPTEPSVNPAHTTTTAHGAHPPAVFVETPAEEKGSLPTQPDVKPSSTSPSVSGTSTPRYGIPTRPALMDRSEEDVRVGLEGMTEEESEMLRKKDRKKGGLSKEQREALAAYDLERKKLREERVATLSKKLLNRISIWTETNKDPVSTRAFQEKTRLEVENLKMESFGLEILHAIGTTYLQKGTAFLKSQRFLGITGFFSRLKDKGMLAKDTWNTISSAIDAQVTMEEMAKAEEKGGEDWTDEKRVEYERRVTGKILTAAWRGSKFEIQSVLRDVCDEVLNDKSVPLSKRQERAEALILCGEIFQKVWYLYSIDTT
jgi:hypothetical protein